MRIYRVCLEDVRLFGYHGLFSEERILGNWFILNLSISKQITIEFGDNIDRTMDYGQLYAICVEIMRDPVDLLETLCEKIALRCKDLHPEFLALEIRIGKEHPPMGLMGGRSSVVWRESSLIE